MGMEQRQALLCHGKARSTKDSVDYQTERDMDLQWHDLKFYWNIKEMGTEVMVTYRETGSIPVLKHPGRPKEANSENERLSLKIV